MVNKPTGPIAACVVNGKSTVFYVDSDSFLVTLANKVKSDTETVEILQGPNKVRRDNYRDDSLKVNDENVTSSTKDIAAISYNLSSDPSGSKNKARIYYITPDGLLAELCNDNDTDWYNGSLDKVKFKAVKDTPITATWSPGNDSIKVYYYSPVEGTKAPYVAWIDKSTKEWKTNFIVKDQ